MLQQRLEALRAEQAVQEAAVQRDGSGRLQAAQQCADQLVAQAQVGRQGHNLGQQSRPANVRPGFKVEGIVFHAADSISSFTRHPAEGPVQFVCWLTAPAVDFTHAGGRLLVRHAARQPRRQLRNGCVRAKQPWQPCSSRWSSRGRRWRQRAPLWWGTTAVGSS